MRVGTVLGLVVVVVVAGALWTVARQSRRAPARPPAPAAGVPDTSAAAGDEIIEQALGQIADDDSTLIKMRWMDEVQGVDLGGLSGKRREVFLRHANSRRCTCGCGYTLAACRTYDPTCPKSGAVLEALRDSVLDGHIRNADGLRERPERAPGG